MYAWHTMIIFECYLAYCRCKKLFLLLGGEAGGEPHPSVKTSALRWGILTFSCSEVQNLSVEKYILHYIKFDCSTVRHSDIDNHLKVSLNDV